MGASILKSVIGRFFDEAMLAHVSLLCEYLGVGQ